MPKKSLSATVLALGAAALFVAGLFLPAVDLVPWAPGFNTMMLSFIGVFTLGAGSIPHFIACLMGALANLAMLWTFVQIVRGKRIKRSIPITAVVVTILVLIPLQSISPETGLGVVSTGYYCWAAAALLLLFGRIVCQSSGKAKLESPTMAGQADKPIETSAGLTPISPSPLRGGSTQRSRRIIAATAAILTLAGGALIVVVQARKLAYKEQEIRWVQEGHAVVDAYFRNDAGNNLSNAYGAYLRLDGTGFGRPFWNIQGYHYLTLDRRAVFSKGAMPVRIHVVEARAADFTTNTVAIVSVEGVPTSDEGLTIRVAHPQLKPPG